jgi:hypothetical protein
MRKIYGILLLQHEGNRLVGKLELGAIIMMECISKEQHARM